MKKWLTASNIIFLLSMLFALIVTGKIYYDRQQLPAGACPITQNSGLLYTAIAVLVMSIIVTSILDYSKKKQKVKEEEKPL